MRFRGSAWLLRFQVKNLADPHLIRIWLDQSVPAEEKEVGLSCDRCKRLMQASQYIQMLMKFKSCNSFISFTSSTFDVLDQSWERKPVKCRRFTWSPRSQLAHPHRMLISFWVAVLLEVEAGTATLASAPNDHEHDSFTVPEGRINFLQRCRN